MNDIDHYTFKDKNILIDYEKHLNEFKRSKTKIKNNEIKDKRLLWHIRLGHVSNTGKLNF